MTVKTLTSYLLVNFLLNWGQISANHCPNTGTVCVWVLHACALTGEHTLTGTHRHFCDHPVRLLEQLCLTKLKKTEGFH